MLTVEKNFKHGSKLLPHSYLRGSVSGEALREIRRDIKLRTWNVRILYRAGSLKAAARELARYKLDIVGVQEFSWDEEGKIRAGVYNFFYGKENENHQFGTVFLCIVE